MTKTKPCDRAHAAARLAIAANFIEAAELPELLADEDNIYRGNAQVANYVQAGIAAADAICCIELKEHSWGDNHATAVNLIKKVAHDGPDLAKALGTLLPLKTDASLAEDRTAQRLVTIIQGHMDLRIQLAAGRHHYGALTRRGLA